MERIGRAASPLQQLLPMTSSCRAPATSRDFPRLSEGRTHDAHCPRAAYFRTSDARPEFTLRAHSTICFIIVVSIDANNARLFQFFIDERRCVWFGTTLVFYSNCLSYFFSIKQLFKIYARFISGRYIER